jgi:tripartite-type tricarboxylate transporter receptor subunit TctC
VTRRVAFLVALLVALGLVGPGGRARADDYPSRPIHMIVPFAAGGPSDILARLVGNKLTEAWGQPVVIDNRAGASGIIGTELAVKAAPDGYTLILDNLGDAISVGLYPKLPYDLVRDLRPVSLVADSPFMLVVHPSVPVHSVTELIALARAKPGALAFASAGVGVPSHMAGELLKSMAHIDLTHVPYKGQAPATADVLSGQVPLMFTNPLNGLVFVRDGKLRALGISTAHRIAAAPDIPTVAESGLPGFDVGIWFGIQAPAATPDPIVRKLADQIRRILEAPDMRAGLAAQGAEPLPEGPEAFAARIRADIDKWSAVIKAAGLHPE